MNKSFTKKLPAYGKALADRWQFRNPPSLVIVNIGGDSWKRAKCWNTYANFAALVLNSEQNPSDLIWQVGGCPVLIEWGTGPSATLIMNLVGELLKASAASVTVSPLFVDHKKPAFEYDIKKPFGRRWLQVRECLQTYYGG